MGRPHDSCHVMPEQTVVTLPRNAGPLRCEFGILRQTCGYGEEVLQRGADCPDPTGGGDSSHKGGYVPQVRHLGEDIPPLEEYQGLEV